MNKIEYPNKETYQFKKPELNEITIKTIHWGFDIPEFKQTGNRYGRFIEVPVYKLPAKVKLIDYSRPEQFRNKEKVINLDDHFDLQKRIPKWHKPDETIAVRYYALNTTIGYSFEEMQYDVDLIEKQKANGTYKEDITGRTKQTEYIPERRETEVVFEREIDPITWKTTKVIIDKYNLIETGIDKANMTNEEVKKYILQKGKKND